MPNKNMATASKSRSGSASASKPSSKWTSRLTRSSSSKLSISKSNYDIIDIDNLSSIAPFKLQETILVVDKALGAHSHELNREFEQQILVNLSNPASILREKFKRGCIYYEVQLNEGKKIKLKDQDALKLMPNELLAYYEKLYNWADIGMYNMTLAELVRQTEYLQHVIIRSNRKNLKVQHIRGGLRTTEGFFLAVKWKNIFAYDYVDVNFMKEHHLEQILHFYQGLSLTQEYCKGLFN